jgi:hypothetical protein
MRPTDLPPADRFAHGTRSRYVSGCRCADCREANRLYYHVRVKAKIFGDWNGLVLALTVRRYLRTLSRKGVGYKTVAVACDVSATCLAEVLAGRKKWIRARTQRKVLQVTADAIADGALVSAKQTWKRINELLEEGFTERELARRLGYRTLKIQLNRFFNHGSECESRRAALSNHHAMKGPNDVSSD